MRLLYRAVGSGRGWVYMSRLDVIHPQFPSQAQPVVLSAAVDACNRTSQGGANSLRQRSVW